MTHDDIFKKYLIEYDKASVTTSFPSLTDYEIATILDKAYLALIAQKFTGNNARSAAFESDAKAVEDVRPLIKRDQLTEDLSAQDKASNEFVFTLPSDILYYVDGSVSFTPSVSSLDNKDHSMFNMYLLPHAAAQQYKATATNLPWIKNPVCYMEDDTLRVLIDMYLYKQKHVDPSPLTPGTPVTCSVTYISAPNKFVDDYDTKDSTFELNDSMAEELINLAIIMSLEIVESTRLNNKINTSKAEA